MASGLAALIAHYGRVSAPVPTARIWQAPLTGSLALPAGHDLNRDARAVAAELAEDLDRERRVIEHFLALVIARAAHASADREALQSALNQVIDGLSDMLGHLQAAE
jgi:hypothetical protein